MGQTAMSASLPSQAQFERWIAGLPEPVAEAVRAHSPFVPHRLKGTEKTVYIARFQEGEPGEPRVKVSVVAPESANPAQVGDLAFDGIDPDDLYSLAS